jgi:hypothetical protein
MWGMIKPLVYQIAIGKIPECIQECMSTVRDYAHRHGYDYECETVVTDTYKHLGYREASEWMRGDKLASMPYVLYVDWDLKILKDFELGVDIITIKVTDALLYFGKHINLAKKVVEKAKEKYFNNYKPGVLHFAFKEIVPESSKYIIEDNIYRHLLWNISGKTFYLQKE